MGVTFGPGVVRAFEARLAEVTAERDRLAAALEAAQHGPDCLAGCCDGAKPPCGPCTCGRDEATS